MNYSKKEVIEKLKILEKKLGRRPVKRDDSRLYVLSRRYFGTWNKMMREYGYECKNIQKVKIPNKFTYDFYYFLGLVSTDGHIQALKEKNSYRILLYTSEDEERDMILRLIELLFSYKASVRSRKTGFSKRPNYEIYISSKNLAFLLNDKGIPFGSKWDNMILPKIIVGCENKAFWNYLRGVFDGDGSIIFSGKNKSFKVSSGSKIFLEGLKNKLLNEGFFYVGINKQTDTMWELRISRAEELKKLYSLFYNDAHFFYSRKKLKWQKQYV